MGKTKVVNITTGTSDIWVEKLVGTMKYRGREPCKIENVDGHFMTEHFSIKKYAMAIIPGIFLPQCQYKFDVNSAAAKKQLFFPPSKVKQSLQMCEYWTEYNLQ